MKKFLTLLILLLFVLPLHAAPPRDERSPGVQGGGGVAHSHVGTVNQVNIVGDGTATVTFSTPQDIDTNADVEFDSLILDDLTALRLVATDALKLLVSTDLASWVTGTGGQIVVTDDLDGTITLSSPIVAGLWRQVATDNFFGPASAGAALTTGDYNTIGGEDAGASLTDATYATIFGNNAAPLYDSGNEDIFIGANVAALATGWTEKNIGIGGNALNNMSAGATYNIAIGSQSLNNMTNAYGNVMVGRQAGLLYTTGIQNVSVGYLSASGDPGTSDYNVSVGATSLGKTDDSNYNTAVGTSALAGDGVAQTDITGDSNTALGSLAGRFVGGASNRNLYLGESAGPIAVTVESDQLYIGNSVDPDLVRGDFSTSTITINGDLNVTGAVGSATNIWREEATDNFFGPAVAGASLTTGDENVGGGDETLGLLTTGDENTGFGYKNLAALVGGNYNTSVGAYGMLATDEGDNNTTIGWGVLGQNVTGSNNFAGGYEAGYRANADSDNNIFLGFRSGPATLAEYNNTLWIDTDFNDTPLIYGDFSTDDIVINGDFEIAFQDPAIVFDGSTAGDTDFWMGVTADEVGDDNDDLQFGKGTTKGTTPFFTFDENGGFQSQNLTDSTTGVQIFDADGGTPIFNVDTTNERVGIGTNAPDIPLHIVLGGAPIVSGITEAAMIIQKTSPSSAGCYAIIAGGVSGASGIYLGDGVGLRNGRILYSNSPESMSFWTNNANKMTILSGGEVGINTTGPDRKLDVLDASNPQRRDSHTDGSIFTDFQTDGNGDYSILPSGDKITLSVGTKHDGFVIRNPAEVQTLNNAQTTLDNVTLLDENTYHVEAWVVGVQSDGTDRASYHIACTVYRTGAGGATLQGGVTSLHTQESNGALDATFTVNANDIVVSVTGIAAETWEWGTTMKYMNMSN